MKLLDIILTKMWDRTSNTKPISHAYLFPSFVPMYIVIPHASSIFISIYFHFSHVEKCKMMDRQEQDHCEDLEYKYILFDVVWGWSNEQGIKLSAVGACCYWVVWLCSAVCPSLRIRPSFFPPRSPSLPLSQCFYCCSWPCLQMSTRTEQLFSIWGAFPTPIIDYTGCHVWEVYAFVMWTS